MAENPIQILLRHISGTVRKHNEEEDYADTR